MGSHGPLRNPDSRRGQRFMPGFEHDKPEMPIAPKWLSADAQKVFTSLVVDMIAAKVPTKKLDAHAVAMAAHCIAQTHFWVTKEHKAKKLDDRLKFSKQTARYQRDAQTWLAAICATPVSRARIGLRATDEKKAPLPNSVMSILQRKGARAPAAIAPPAPAPIADVDVSAPVSKPTGEGEPVN